MLKYHELSTTHSGFIACLMVRLELIVCCTCDVPLCEHAWVLLLHTYTAVVTFCCKMEICWCYSVTATCSHVELLL